jgi:hypothetical protein
VQSDGSPRGTSPFSSIFDTFTNIPLPAASMPSQSSYHSVTSPVLNLYSNVRKSLSSSLSLSRFIASSYGDKPNTPSKKDVEEKHHGRHRHAKSFTICTNPSVPSSHKSKTRNFNINANSPYRPSSSGVSYPSSPAARFLKWICFVLCFAFVELNPYRSLSLRARRVRCCPLFPLLHRML